MKYIHDFKTVVLVRVKQFHILFAGSGQKCGVSAAKFMLQFYLYLFLHENLHLKLVIVA